MKHFKLQLKDRVYEVSLQPLFTILGWTFAVLKASRKEMANETHSGNLNRSKIVAKPDEGTHSAGKTNDPEATLRKGDLPKGSPVTTVDRSANKGKAIECARKQNLSDQKSGIGNQAQVEAGKERPTTTSSGNCGCK